MIGPKTTALLGEMSLIELIDLRHAYQYSRRPDAPTLLRLLGAEIKIRKRVIRQQAMTVELAHA